MNLSSPAKDALMAELLCIADTNWILGHWYCNCMLNGRELTDFTSMAGIAEDKLGHTRALFRYMEETFELPDYQLEFGRSVEKIHSMALLDAPPQNWADFVLTLYLADVAVWKLSSTLREGNVAAVANLLTKFGEEAYFHQLCIDGWLKALDENEKADLLEALPKRLPFAVSWFVASSADVLSDDGVRTQSVDDAREAFTQTVLAKLKDIVSIESAVFEASTTEISNAPYDALRRRPTGSTMPPRLWESVVPTSKEALLARRPLAVSVDDNIDLFVAVKKDDTEPKFR
ncbi:MAG: Phenylacetic acid catabolic protein [Gammaproteobacteria bacterium]